MPLSDSEILMRLTPIFRNIFDDQSLDPTPDMTADGIAGWDSMSQVTLAVEIEHDFGVKFRSAEMEELSSVRELVELIKSRAVSATA
jgi:acyl carrier protein